MNKLLRMRGFAEIGEITLVGLIGILVVPFVIGFYDHIAPLEILGLITSIVIFQPFAAVIGLGLGIDPVSLLLIMCSFGISVIFVLFGICDIFAERSEWLRNHLKKTEAITQESGLLKKYGMYALVPFIWVPGVGLYGCVLIAWLFKWRGVKPVSVIFAGWILAVVLVLLTSLGILKIIL
jgi:uncharacterized membrane protein